MSMKNQQQGLDRNLLAFIAMRLLFEGCENYFITPTVLHYLKSLGQTEQYVAVVIMSYNVGSLLMSPLIGRIADRFGRVDLLIIMCLVMKVFGNLLYSINTNAAFPLVGRILCGMGRLLTSCFYVSLL